MACTTLLFLAAPVRADWNWQNAKNFNIGHNKSFTKVHSTSKQELRTSMKLLGGVNRGPATIVQTAWATRNASEQWIYSDLLRLTGLDGNKVVLEMSYDPKLFPPGMEDYWSSTGENTIYIYTGTGEPGWQSIWKYFLDEGQTTIEPGDPLFNFQGSWKKAGKPLELGAFGVNQKTKSVWAITNRNGVYGPEPATLSLLAFGALGLLRRRRR